MKSSQKYMVVFQPSGRIGYIERGKTLREASVIMGLQMEGVCAGKGLCGKCKVRVEEGYIEKYGITSDHEHLSEMGPTERKFFSPKQESEGYRLACQARILGDVVLFLPDESRMGRQMVRKAARDIEVELRPAVREYYVEMVPAALEDSMGDWERLETELKRKYGLRHLSIDYQTLICLQDIVREGNWRVTTFVWKNREVIKIEPGVATGVYGLAVDVGTTTVAGYLCDLTDGRVVASVSMMNPQVVCGDDVISRISHAMTNPEGLEEMNKAIVDGLNWIVEEAAALAGIKRFDIVDMTVVGNTCMHHLFLNIHPRNIGRSPFSPALHRSLDVKARDCGLKPVPDKQKYDQAVPNREIGIKIAPGAYVHMLPVEAGFVGADNVAMLIAEEPHLQDSIELLIDIGTNGELVLGNRQKMISSSCATGPAFEGGTIKHGMRAASGAIEKIVIDKETKEVSFKVVDKEGWNTEIRNIGAKGICGSGIIDVVPQLFLAGVIDQTGRFDQGLQHPRFRVNKNVPEFVIAWSHETSIGCDIVIDQDDVRAIQLAKGAMYAAAKIMMRALGVAKIDKVVLAGAFGSCIDKVSAALLGLFPDCELENIYSVGNAAGDGARMALLNLDKRLEADKLARSVQYVELTLDPDFDRAFAQAMWIPHMKDEFPHVAHLLAERR